MRPGEVCGLRPGDLDLSGEVWVYLPARHKSEHHGRERRIYIGPRGQEILRPYLTRPADAYCFSPAESEQRRRAAQHQSRRTPLDRGNRPGTNRSQQPQRPAREQYSATAYCRAIARACELAFSMPSELRNWRAAATAQARERLRQEAAAWRARHVWSPNQLRHAAATDIRRQFGLEAAQAALGHSQADVTQIYAERDFGLAATVAQRLG